MDSLTVNVYSQYLTFSMIS